MTIIILENPKVKNSNICEFFGLSNSGKSTYVKSMISRGVNCCIPYRKKHLRKLGRFFQFFLNNPISTLRLFYKLNTDWIKLSHLSFKKYFRIFLMRNSYLTAVFARYQELDKKEVYADEFFLQSLFMILQNKSNKREISTLMNLFPKSKRFSLVEIDSETRYRRLNKNSFPGEIIDRKYALIWMKNMEFNYNLVKKILLENCNIVRISQSI
jgi:hypothetical protein